MDRGKGKALPWLIVILMITAFGTIGFHVYLILFTASPLDINMFFYGIIIYEGIITILLALIYKAISDIKEALLGAIFKNTYDAFREELRRLLLKVKE